jgi:hypothetical protein
MLLDEDKEENKKQDLKKKFSLSSNRGFHAQKT